jgi:protein-glutamine gamma-glutamyltransferase
LMMIAACISTASLWFALILIVFLCLSLYCCLLFHLKVESDEAKRVMGLSVAKPNAATLRQDERFLGGSLIRLTVLVAIVSLSTAVAVFIFFPRMKGVGMFANLQFKSSQTLMGFKPEVAFEQIAEITRSDTIVAHVRIWKNGQPVSGFEPLELRGMTLDVYGGNGSTGGKAWTWSRSAVAGHDTHEIDPLPRGDDGSSFIRQDITLQPTGTMVLFAIAGPHYVVPTNFDKSILISSYDEVLQVQEATAQQLTYQVFSSGTLDAADAPSTDTDQEDSNDSASQRPPAELSRPQRTVNWRDFPAVSGNPGAPTNPDDARGWHERQMRQSMYTDQPTHSVIDPAIENIARRPEVSGYDARGSLAARREPTARITALDIPIALNIERYLRAAPFSYTLDLTDTHRPKDVDPLLFFLTTTHRGHCEYFAGAMALMCQSLGLQARVCVGFNCDDFNPLNNEYLVRQSHAHAWVEVEDDHGHWESFDPTTSRGAQAVQHKVSMMTRLRHLIDFLDFAWARSVIAYDTDSHASVVQAVDDSLLNGRDSSAQALDRLRGWLESIDVDAIAGQTVGPVMILFIATLIGAVIWYVIEQWLLKRRAKRIGLAALPTEEQIRLARQLGFYDELLRLLERRRIVRPPHQTPLEFSRSMTFLSPSIYDSIRRLTLVFYKVRFGGHTLTPGQRRHLDNVLARIALHLRRRTTGA